MTITGQKVLEILKKDSIFLNTIPKCVQEAYYKFVIMLPEILSKNGMLSQLVNSLSVIKALMLFDQYKIDNGYAKAMAEVATPEVRCGSTKEEMAQSLQQFLIQNMEYFRQKNMELANFQKSHTLNRINPEKENEMFLHLTGEAYKLFLANNLTFEKLLELQPSILVVPQ
jgi:hypothetical protein